MQNTIPDALTTSLEQAVTCGVLVAVRLSGLFVFAPVFSSPAIATRIKAAFVIAVTFLIAPLLVGHAEAMQLTVAGVLGELGIGLVFGLSLSLLTEMVTFASSLIGMEFSFSLVNLLDPVSQIETPVLGQLLSWVNVLVLLGAGLHRTLLAAMIRSFAIVPVGTAAMHATSPATLVEMASGIFLVGVQLASPVLAAGLAVEITVALMGRLAPQLPANVLSVPVKTLTSYTVLIASLALWPNFLEHRFTSLLLAAEKMVAS